MKESLFRWPEGRHLSTTCFAKDMVHCNDDGDDDCDSNGGDVGGDNEERECIFKSYEICGYILVNAIKQLMQRQMQYIRCNKAIHNTYDAMKQNITNKT